MQDGGSTAGLAILLPRWLVRADPTLAMAVADPMYQAFLERRRALVARGTIPWPAVVMLTLYVAGWRVSATAHLSTKPEHRARLAEIVTSPTGVRGLACALYAETCEQAVATARSSFVGLVLMSWLFSGPFVGLFFPALTAPLGKVALTVLWGIFMIASYRYLAMSWTFALLTATVSDWENKVLGWTTARSMGVLPPPRVASIRFSYMLAPILLYFMLVPALTTVSSFHLSEPAIGYFIAMLVGLLPALYVLFGLPRRRRADMAKAAFEFECAVRRLDRAVRTALGGE